MSQQAVSQTYKEFCNGIEKDLAPNCGAVILRKKRKPRGTLYFGSDLMVSKKFHYNTKLLFTKHTYGNSNVYVCILQDLEPDKYVVIKEHSVLRTLFKMNIIDILIAPILMFAGGSGGGGHFPRSTSSIKLVEVAPGKVTELDL